MEPSSQSLVAIESFSNSWLTSSVNSSLDCLEGSFRPSIDGFHDFNSRELDYKMFKSRRSIEESHKFYFDIPVLLPSSAAGSSSTVAPADQLFSDGVIKPTASYCLYSTKSQTMPSPPSLPNPAAAAPPPPPPSSAAALVSAVNIQCQVLGRWRKLSARVLLKYFRRLKCSWVIRSSRKSIRVDDVDTRRVSKKVHSLSNSPRVSSPSAAYSTDGNWSDADSSIYEAVLYCKRSNS